jgi:hypothetical protein
LELECKLNQIEILMRIETQNCANS